MFIEENKKEVELKMVDAVMKMSNKFFFDDWEYIMICSVNMVDMISGSYIVVFDDGTFLNYGDLYMFSGYNRDELAEYTCDFASISREALDVRTTDSKKPTNLMLMDLKRDGTYCCEYYENLHDYNYAGTPEAIWKYKKVGLNDQKYGIKEAEKFIKKCKIVPERILKVRLDTMDLKALVENLLFKFMYCVYEYLPEDTLEIYFHLDNICGKNKFSFYIKASDKILKLNNSTYAEDSYQNLISICNEWVEYFNYIHGRCNRKKYTAIDYVYNLASSELSYTYDNITEDNFNDEFALTKAWEDKYFSQNPMKKLLNKFNKNNEALLIDSMIIDRNRLIDKKDNEKEEENMNIVAEKFEGEDINDLVPLYFQNGYGIISSILPNGWSKLYFYTEDDGIISRQLGYVVIGDEYITLEDLPKRKVCSKEIYIATIEQLKLWSNYFRKAFSDHNMEPWTVFSYSLDSEGNISTDFQYISLGSQKNPNENFDLWSYKHLGIRDNIPKDVNISNITPANIYKKIR